MHECNDWDLVDRSSGHVFPPLKEERPNVFMFMMSGSSGRRSIYEKPILRPLPDDTPIYDKEEDDTTIVDILTEDEEEERRRAHDKLVEDELLEIKSQLDSANIPAFRFSDPAWRSAFFTLNTTEVLTEEELAKFISEYTPNK